VLRKKKEIKRISLISIFIILILISNLPAINEFDSKSDKKDIRIPIDREDYKIPKSSGNLNLTDFISGKGVDRTVRTFMNNRSRSENNNGYFNITAPVPNANLSSGEFYFNFDNNFTAKHIIEGDSALKPQEGSYFEEYPYNHSYSSIKIHNGTGFLTGNFDDLIDKSYSTYWNISSSNGFVNFTICANFSGVISDISHTSLGKIKYNRKKIMGFILNTAYDLNLDANVTVYMKDFYDTGEFKNITNTIEINSTLGPHSMDELILNRNLIYINASDCALIRFTFDRSDNSDFNVKLKIPGEFLIWATGELQNPNEIYTSDFYKKIEKSKQTDEVIHLVIPQFLTKVPFRKSSSACWISSCVFMTNGPYLAMGSFRGLPEISKNRTASL